MREILYRSKRFDNGEWVYGSLVQMLVDGRIATCICPIEEVGKANKDVPQMGILYTLNEDIFIVDPATIGEYTGLTDKNGNKIFEGDILRYPPKEKIEINNYVSYEVFWHDNDCADRHIGWQINRYHYHGNVCGTINDFTTCLPKYTEKMIIIGNVFDMKGGEK